MRAGAERVRSSRSSWFWLACFGLGLFACGGRTLDDGVYGFTGTSSGNTSCSYRGKSYANGSLIPDACVCFCDNGQVECEQGCALGNGGTTSGGASGGDGNATSGGSSTAGTATGGTLSFGGTSTGGSPAGGDSGASVGGSIGTGGVTITCGSPPRATGSNPLIDDMEDDNAYILPNDGRSGVWFTYNDASAGGYQFPSAGNFTMQPSPNPATNGQFAANTYGKGFLSWGAGMGFVLNSGCPYDASVHTGLYFFARSEMAASSIYVLVPTAATTPASNGGTCVAVSSTACYDDYQVAISVYPTWTGYFVPFSELTQQGWGTRASFDPRTLMGVNFQTRSGDGYSFSFSIDSISFY
jgi:hypothetical protein